jgi:hypothetical protein
MEHRGRADNDAPCVEEVVPPAEAAPSRAKERATPAKEALPRARANVAPRKGHATAARNDATPAGAAATAGRGAPPPARDEAAPASHDGTMKRDAAPPADGSPARERAARISQEGARPSTKLWSARMRATLAPMASAIALLLAVGGGHLGCIKTQTRGVPLYPQTEPLPDVSRVALLSGYVRSVDGQNVSARGSVFELLPGCHVVRTPESWGRSSRARIDSRRDGRAAGRRCHRLQRFGVAVIAARRGSPLPQGFATRMTLPGLALFVQ